ncbi:hypothetical protein [Chryseobacterium sp. c4a]|uniref:hypothetical protein n=1 Tax=Chryseobacterium sp. c4a TaxID=1573582 RepID=UPI001357B3D4|nr:hypothetical protein [Chryseobacterium sp. c4a]
MISSEYLPIIISITFFFTVIIGSILVFVILKKNRNKQNEPITEGPDHTINVPLIGSFILVKGLYPISIANNSISPRLILHDTFVEYKVLFTKKRAYNEIQQVHILLAPLTTNIILEFKDSRKSFAGNLNNKQKLAEVLRILKQKCPLSLKAQQFIEEAEQM